jgi:hypothetical protein
MDVRRDDALLIRQRGARADRIVAAGALIAFLVTGLYGEDPAPSAAGTAARAVQHAASVAAARR